MRGRSWEIREREEEIWVRSIKRTVNVDYKERRDEDLLLVG